MKPDEVLWMLESYEQEVSWLPNNVNPHGEMDNILDGRDVVEDHKALLSETELARLQRAHEHLRKYAKEVYSYLSRDPRKYREKYNVPRSRWWWYVDELTET